MYRAIFYSNDQSEYYFDDQLLFSVKRKRLLLGVRSICTIYKNEDIICEFYNAEFTILFWELKILKQKLDKEVALVKRNFTYNLVVNMKFITIKFTRNPFKKVIGKMFIDGECIGEIEKNEKNNTYFDFNFYNDNGLEYYILVLFSMYSVGITDSV